MKVVINTVKIVKGKVKWYSNSKGFGFLSSDSIPNDIFVHYSAIDSDVKALNEGQEVKFELEDGVKGYQAFSVVPLTPYNWQENADEQY